MFSHSTIIGFCIAGIEGPRGKRMVGRSQVVFNGTCEDVFNSATSMRIGKGIVK